MKADTIAVSTVVELGSRSKTARRDGVSFFVFVVVLLVTAASLTCACSLLLSSEEFAGGARTEPPDTSLLDASASDATATTDAVVGDDETALGDASSAATDADAAGSEEEGLIGYWKLDDGTGLIATDSSKSHNNGTLQGSAAWTTMAKVNGGISFGGPSAPGHVSIPAHPSLDVVADTFTLTWWMKPTGGLVGDNPRVYSHGFSFDVKINNARPQLTLAGKYSIAVFETAADAWHHYAVTFNRGAIGWYVDGVPTAVAGSTFVGGEVAVPMAAPIRIGTNANQTDPYFFAGDVDEVRLYIRVLAASEVAKLAN